MLSEIVVCIAIMACANVGIALDIQSHEQLVMIGDGFEVCGEVTQTIADQMKGDGFAMTLSHRIIGTMDEDESDESESQHDSVKPTPDLNGSGIVDAEDLILLLSAWGPQSMYRDSFSASADLTADGLVNEDDLTILLAAWGNVQNPIVPTE